MRVTKIEVLAHRQDGNGEPECGHVEFDDGKRYGFENTSYYGVRFHRPHHRYVHAVVPFKSSARAEALVAAFNDDKV